MNQERKSALSALRISLYVFVGCLLLFATWWSFALVSFVNTDLGGWLILTGLPFIAYFAVLIVVGADLIYLTFVLQKLVTRHRLKQSEAEDALKRGRQS